MQKYSVNSVSLVLLGFFAMLVISMVSCGEGKVTKESEDDYVWLDQDIMGEGGLINLCLAEGAGSKPSCEKILLDYCARSGGCLSSGSGEEPPSSSSEEEEFSSSSEEEESSSSSEEEESSSSSESPSSSSEPPPSSSSYVPTEELTCSVSSKTGVPGDLIPFPTVKCGTETIDTKDINFTIKDATGAIKTSWTPAAGVYEFSAAADCDSVVQTVPCGKVYVGVKEFKCAVPATKLEKGAAIPAPAATCNGDTVTTGFTWTPQTIPQTAPDSVSVTATAAAGSDCAGAEVAQCGKIAVETPSSSSATEQSSSSEDDGESSSSEGDEDSSSSSEPSSSSSSSSGPAFICSGLATTGTVGVQFAVPTTLTCGGIAVNNNTANNFTWDPATRTPTVAGDNISVSVTATSGNCNGKTAECGTIKVSEPGPLTCTVTGITGIVGKAISAPTIACNGTNLNGITWTPSNLTPTVPGDFVVSGSATPGLCASDVECAPIPVVSPTINCTNITGNVVKGTDITPPVLTCTNGLTPNVTWEGRPNPSDWKTTTATAGPYTISVATAKCGTYDVSTTLPLPCGTVTVKEPEPSIPLAITAAATDMPKGTYSATCVGGYNLTCWTTSPKKKIKIDSAEFEAELQKGWANISNKCHPSNPVSIAEIENTYDDGVIKCAANN